MYSDSCNHNSNINIYRSNNSHTLQVNMNNETSKGPKKLLKTTSEGSLSFVTKGMSKNLESRVISKLDRLMEKIEVADKKLIDAKEKYENASKEIEKLDNIRAEKMQVNQIMKKAMMKFSNNRKNNSSNANSNNYNGKEGKNDFSYHLDLQELKLMNNENDRLIAEATKSRSIYEKKNKKCEQLHQTLDSIIVLIQQCKISCEEEGKDNDDFNNSRQKLSLIAER